MLFFCYKGAVEGKNPRKNGKSQDFGLETFFVKGSNMVQELQTDDREFYFGCVYILFILAGYLNCTVILFSCQLVTVH